MTSADERLSALAEKAAQRPEQSWIRQNFTLSTIMAAIAHLVVVVALIAGMRVELAQSKETIGNLQTSVSKLQQDSDRIVRVEERVAGIQKTLDTLASKLDRVFERGNGNGGGRR